MREEEAVERFLDANLRKLKTEYIDGEPNAELGERKIFCKHRLVMADATFMMPYTLRYGSPSRHT